MAAGDKAPILGTLTYNGFAFTSSMKTTINSSFDYDDAGRSVKCVRYTIEVEDVIADDADTGSRLEIARRLLSTPGATLALSGFGFGEMNLDSSRQDVIFGPTPKVLAWHPIGANKSVYVKWSCETHVVECTTTVFSGRPLAYNYTASFRIDEYGMTTRTISGYLEIPGYTNAQGELTDIADAHLDSIVVVKPDNFKRSSSRDISADKRRLNFSVTDTEIASPNAFPNGIVDIRIEETIATSITKGFNDWTIGFGGSFTTACNTSGMNGWRAVLAAISSRLESVGTYGKGKDSTTGAPVSSSLYFLSFNLREEIYGRTTSFNFTFRTLCNLDTILKASGMWTSVTATSGANWASWTGSLGNNFNNRGEAQLVLDKSNDALVNMCSPTIPQITGAAQTVYAQGGLSQMFGLTIPSKETSYSAGEMALYFDKGKTTVRHSPIKATPASPATPTTPGPNNEMSGDDTSSGGGADFDENADDDMIQTIGEASYDVRLAGHIIRVGYPIELPELLSIGGRTAHLTDSSLVQKIVGGTNDCPVFAMKFDCAYVLDNAPSSSALPYPPNFAAGYGLTEV